MRALAMLIGLAAMMLTAGSALPVDAAGPLPDPVKTCQDARAYLDADNSMAMETFKKLLTASGKVLDERATNGLDQQCTLTAYVKHVMFLQHLGTRDDGSAIVASTEVVMDNGVCRLINVTFDDC